MIKTDFFPTVDDSTLFGIQKSNFYSALLPTSIPNAYWLGWLSYDNLPKRCLLSKFESDGETITGRIVTETSNFNFGYVENSGILLCKNDEDSTSFISSEAGDTQFYNKLNVMGVSVRSFRIYYVINGNFSGSTTYYTDYVTFDIEKIMQFINGDTVTFSILGVDYQLSKDSFSEGYYHNNSGNNDFILVLHSIYANYDDWTYSPTGDPYYQYYYPSPCFKFDTEDGTFMANLNVMRIQDITGFYGVNISTDGTIITQGLLSGVYGTGSDFSIGLNDLLALVGTNNFVKNGTCIFYYISNLNRFEGLPILTVDDISKYVALQIRLTHHNFGYSVNDVYAPLVTENNEFTATNITGNLSDDSFKNQLRKWQYELTEWAENNYNEEDLPPYEPEPSGDESDSSGDNILPYDFSNTPMSATNNFTSLYVMSTSQVAEFGRILWASLWSEDFWHSVGTVFANDFSINPADMMNYFISLRFFPFDLSNVQSTIAGIYIGRSTTPLRLSSNVNRLSRNVVQLNGGSVTIGREYNDFRDYEPCTQIQVFVPFCGTAILAPSEVMGYTLYLDYVIDMQTGAIKATISVQSDNTFFTVATLTGMCSANIPITANNNIEYLQRIASTFSGTVSKTAEYVDKGNDIAGTGGAIAGAVAGLDIGLATSMMGLPPVKVHTQGQAGGFSNYGGTHRAYIIISREQYVVPDNYGRAVGYATNITRRLGDLSGFTICRNAILNDIPATEPELNEIRSYLESGIIL